MTPFSEHPGVTLYHGDCFEVMAGMEAESVESIVTDPPYGIRFMGKAWDGEDIEERMQKRRTYHHDDDPRAGINGGHNSRAAEAGKYDRTPHANRAFQEWCEMWASEALRVAKPGAHLLVFGGTRTFHRLASAIEDAGWEIRDTIMWVFGSGYPKSLNVGKAMKSQEDAGKWKEWGTGLKPAWEPIIVARKPLIGTVVENVLTHGTGALNIDRCRVETGESLHGRGSPPLPFNGQNHRPFHECDASVVTGNNGLGRWPANLIHDGSDEVLAQFPDSPGQLADASTNSEQRETQSVYGAMRMGRGEESSAQSENRGAVGFKKPGERRLDSGSAARFFYCSKASREDRNKGCEELSKEPLLWSNGTKNPGSFQSDGTKRSAKNHHPTVKPTDLMRYLCRLVTPPGGLVLDPFMGSGSTGKAAQAEGFRFVGIEQDESYCNIADRRMAQGVLL
ncbi:MAG: site-specific DNA-methyltransferase [Nitrospirota bacterium]|nr:site-specific DNA-methyltransferase [Nitrospirota bacterium]